MTALVTIHNGKEIIMAADSLMLMGTVENLEGSQVVNKIIYHSHHNVGISAAGEGLKSGIYFKDEVFNFLKVMPTQRNLSDLVAHLGEFLKGHPLQFKVQCSVCGYQGDSPQLYDLSFDNNWNGHRLTRDMFPFMSIEVIDEIRTHYKPFQDKTTNEIIKYIAQLFDMEIKCQRHKYDAGLKKVVDVSYPLDICILSPNRTAMYTQLNVANQKIT